MKFFKKISILIFVFLIFLIAFIFFSRKNNDAVFKKRKALNYSLTYKQAFPDENLRYAVLYCISTGKCNDQNLEEKLKLDIVNSDGTEDWIIKPSKITAEMKAKENTKLSATYLNNIKVFALKDEGKDKRIKDLTGIEYLNLANMIVTDASATSSFDISTLTKLQKINIYGEDPDSKACNIKTGNQGTNFKDLQVSVKASNREPVLNLDVSKLTSVETIKINYCNYQNLNLGNMIRLKTVDFAYNKLTTFNLRTINNYLRYLDISHNEVTTIPNISHMPFLEHLDISYNRFPAYPFRANQFRRLKNIYAKDSGISIIEVYESPNLEEVSLGGNNFTRFIFDSSVNTKVSKLSITDSPITNEGIQNKQFGSLQSYPGNSNSIREFHFENLPNINSINFNDISSADKIVVKNMNIQEIVQITAYTATEIEITNTNIKDMNITSTHVKKLNLSNNKMEKLNLNTQNVEDVNISNNKLNKLDIFHKNISCEKINYSNNKLMTVNTDKACLSVPQHLEIKVKEGQEVTIPIKYGPETGSYHYGELVENNAIFEKTGFQKYRFKKVGTTTENFNVFYHNHDDDTNTLKGNGGDIVVTVLPGEASNFNPIVTILKTKEGYPSPFTAMDYKNAIKNLPTTIKNFEVDINTLDVSTPGTKAVVTTVTFSDDSVKEIVVPVIVEEVRKDSYNPVVNPIIVGKNQPITEEMYKSAITNLPSNISRFDIIKRADSNSLGQQTAIVNIVFRNGEEKEVTIPVEVITSISETFTPILNTNYKCFTNTRCLFSDMIVNLPENRNITCDTANSMDDMNSNEKGIKRCNMTVMFSDGSHGNYQIKIPVFEKLEPREVRMFKVVNPESKYIEGNLSKSLMLSYAEGTDQREDYLNILRQKNKCNYETFTCQDLVYNQNGRYRTLGASGVGDVISNGYSEYNSVNNNKILDSKVKVYNSKQLEQVVRNYNQGYKFIDWISNEEEKTFSFYSNYDMSVENILKTTILRDTDHDGIPDKDDDDDDNDGISDEQEVLDQTDPKDASSFKVTKICYKIKA